MPKATVSGDFGKLSSWEQLLLNNKVLARPMNASMAEQVIDLIKEGFVAERDPYGQPWAKKKKPDGRKVLSGETGRLKTGWFPQVTASGFVVSTAVEYAAAHQAPRSRKRPRRRMVPSSDRGLPRPWSSALREVALSALTAYYGGGRGGGRGSGRGGRGGGGSGVAGALRGRLTRLARSSVRRATKAKK